MILKNYKNYFLPLTLLFLYSAFIILNIHWTNLSLFIFGSVWEYARTHKELQERSKLRKYQLSFIRVFYKYNSLFKKWPYSEILASSLFLLPVVLIIGFDLSFFNIFLGALSTYILRIFFKRYL